jgi:flagellar basal body-associated protein FliL
MTITAIVFVIFLFAVATITFFVMKKAVKMAIRAAIVALILLIAVVGGISLWMFGTDGNNSDNRPATNKKSR